MKYLLFSSHARYETLHVVLIEMHEHAELHANRPQVKRLGHLEQLHARELRPAVVAHLSLVHEQQNGDRTLGHMRHKVQRAVRDDHLVDFGLHINEVAERRVGHLAMLLEQHAFAFECTLSKAYQTHVNKNAHHKEDHIVEQVVENVKAREQATLGLQEVNGAEAQQVRAYIGAVRVKRIVRVRIAERVIRVELKRFERAESDTHDESGRVQGLHACFLELLEKPGRTRRGQIVAAYAEAHVGDVGAHAHRVA